MTYEGIENDIRYFISEELNDMEFYSDFYTKGEIISNTNFLKSLDEKDIEHISNMIMDDQELNSMINNTIRHYIYHYKKDV